VSAHLDFSKGVRPDRDIQRVNVDVPVHLLREIDQEARRLSVTRQAFIKVRLVDVLGKVGPVVSIHLQVVARGRREL
jgi:hypothetical protein